ncbi:hypothetical protein HY501_02520, partial [Candidatus Woesearchaeota archaeon]|nr:hypothetical protein [Candidatus Woesearchaeota archaeon]
MYREDYVTKVMDLFYGLGTDHRQRFLIRLREEDPTAFIELGSLLAEHKIRVPESYRELKTLVHCLADTFNSPTESRALVPIQNRQLAIVEHQEQVPQEDKYYLHIHFGGLEIKTLGVK